LARKRRGQKRREERLVKREGADKGRGVILEKKAALSLQVCCKKRLHPPASAIREEGKEFE